MLPLMSAALVSLAGGSAVISMRPGSEAAVVQAGVVAMSSREVDLLSGRRSLGQKRRFLWLERRFRSVLSSATWREKSSVRRTSVLLSVSGITLASSCCGATSENLPAVSARYAVQACCCL
jgi:hypothetical protein